MEVPQVVSTPATAATAATTTATATARATTSAPEARKRVRRWHHRGFTGCSTCRRRHVRCDEASPSCNNCTRLGLECDGAQGRITFKIYGLQQTIPGSSLRRGVKKRGRKLVEMTSSDDSGEGPGGEKRGKNESSEEEQVESVVISPATASDSVVEYQVQRHLYSPCLLNSPFDCIDDRYYVHFLNTLSSLLILYDSPENSNPYRHYFPEFARSSQSMFGAMKALGALHLANTSLGRQRSTHFQNAMSQYSEVVKSLRTRWTKPTPQLTLADFATSLLLCIFEMMEAQSENWKVHLSGARDIYRIMFQSDTEDQGDGVQGNERAVAATHPCRRFLVSLLAYFEISTACATVEKTVIDGNCWETDGESCEYHLGIPSLSAEPTANSLALSDLRRSWSRLMEIQAAVSFFGKAKQEGMSYEQQDAIHDVLMSRLIDWRSNAPEYFQLLGDLDDERLQSYQNQEILEYTACVEAHEKATIIYLHLVTGAERPDRRADTATLDALVDRILALVIKLAKGVGQLAILWPLYIAGREAREESKQAFVRAKLTELSRYGFKGIEKAVEYLERIWFERRIFGDGSVYYMKDIQTHMLLP